MVFGQQLRAVSELCQELEVALLLCHRTRKGSGNDFRPLQLTDAAWAGFAEHCRQWLLVNHRERYNHATGTHRLWLSAGGSAGHGGLWAVDVHQGHIDDCKGRGWQVTVSTPNDAKANAAGRKDDERLAEDTKKVIRAMTVLEKQHPEGNSKSAIREHAKLNGPRCDAAIKAAVDNGEAVSCKIKRSNWRTPVDGYKLAGSKDGT